jgi:hypothetical protein
MAGFDLRKKENETHSNCIANVRVVNEQLNKLLALFCKVESRKIQTRANIGEALHLPYVMGLPI